MKVTMLLADSAQAVGGKLYILGGGWSVTGPGPSASAIALKIEVPWDGTNQRHTLLLTLLDADGRPVLFTTSLMERALVLTGDWLDLADDFADLVHILNHAVGDDPQFWSYYSQTTVVDQTLTIATDTLDGGAGNDILVGDDHTVLAPSFTVAVRNADDFEHWVDGLQIVGNELEHGLEELGDVAHHLRDEIVQQKFNSQWKPVLRSHIDQLMIGNDRLLGGDGNDLMVGDQKFHMTPNALVTPGGTPAVPHHHWHDHRWWDSSWWDWEDHDDHRHEHWSDDYWSHHPSWHHHGAGDLITVGNDTMDGGNGNDLMFGDSQAVIAENVTTAPGVSSHDDDEVDDVEDAIEDLTEIGHHDEHWGWWHHHDDDEEDFQVTSGNDVMTGGAGADIMLGQNGRDNLSGGDGDDYLVGGDDGDTLNGGAGKNTVKSGHDTSSTLASKIQTRLIDWSNNLRVFGSSQALVSPSPWISSFELDLDDDCHDEAFIIRPKRP